MRDSASYTLTTVGVEETPNNTVLCLLCGSETQHRQLVCTDCRHRLTTDTPPSSFQNGASPLLVEQCLREETALIGEGIVILETSVEQLTIHLPLNTSIILGCCSQELPDGAEEIIDLTPLGALSMGVSRHHLRLTRHGSLVVVVDLRSATGTWLNGRRIAARVKYVLGDGDELQLGAMIVHVRLQ
jgi:hypothetical protein